MPAIKIFAVIIALCGSASAREFRFSKKVNQTVLGNQLRANGFLTSGSTCAHLPDRYDCTLVLSDDEAKDPSAIIAAHVYTDPEATRASLLAELRSLEAIDDNKKLTVTQARRMRKLILLLTRLSKDTP